MKKKSLPAVLVLWLFCCLPATAETMYATFVAPSETSLTKDRLSLKIDSKEVTVQDLILVQTAQRDTKTTLHPAGRRHYVFLFDLLFNKPEQIAQARNATMAFLKQLPPEELIAVAGITKTDGLRMFSNFTTDRSKTISGLNAFGKPNITGFTEGPDGNLYPSRLAMDEVNLIPEVEFLVNLKSYAIDEKQREEFVPVYLQGMIDLVSLLSTIDGRKHVIVFSSGADVKGLSVDLDLNKEQEKPKQAGEGSEEHKDIQELTSSAPRNYDQLARQGPGARILNRSQGADVVPKLMEGTDTRVHVFNPGSDDRGFVKDLSEKNGGSYNTSAEWNQAIQNIITSDAKYYVVSWDAPREKEFHALHSFELQAQGANMKASEKWLAPKAISDFSPLEFRTRIAKAVHTDFNTAKPGYAFWADFILGSDVHKIPSFVQVPGSELMKAGTQEATLEFYSFAISGSGTVIDFQGTPIKLDLANPALVARLRKTGLKMWNVLLTPRAPVTIRSILVNPDTGEMITHTANLDFKASEFTCTNPFFPSTNLEWIVWPKPDETQTRRGVTFQYPYIVGKDMFFFPDLSPSVAAAESDRVLYFKMYNSPAPDSKPPVHLALQAPDGQTYQIDRFGLFMQPRNVDPQGLELFWKIEALPQVAAGTYRVVVNVEDTSNNRKIERQTVAEIRN